MPGLVHFFKKQLKRICFNSIYLGCDDSGHDDCAVVWGVLPFGGGVQHQPGQKILLRGARNLRQRNFHQTNLLRLHRRQIEVNFVTFILNIIQKTSWASVSAGFCVSSWCYVNFLANHKLRKPPKKSYSAQKLIFRIRIDWIIESLRGKTEK